MNRAVLAGGIMPARVGDAGELRRLTNERDATKRTFEQWQDHAAEIAFVLASWALEEFIKQHPELVQT